jgi:flagellar biosynthesis chaperone FliJ
LEKNIVDELSHEICKLGNEMETFLTILDEKRKHLKDLETNSVNLQRYGTDLQTFHGIGILEKELEELKQYIQCLDYDVRMHNVNIDYHFTSG